MFYRGKELEIFGNNNPTDNKELNIRSRPRGSNNNLIADNEIRCSLRNVLGSWKTAAIWITRA